MPAILPDYAYIRTAPNTEVPLLVVSLPPDTRLSVIGRHDDWYRVSYEGQEGWMYRGTLRILGPIPSLPFVES